MAAIPVLSSEIKKKVSDVNHEMDGRAPSMVHLTVGHEGALYVKL